MANTAVNFKKIGQQLIKDAQTIAEVEMINFVMSNFENQGFTDASFAPWQQRKNNADAGRAILKKSGALQDSVFVSKSNLKRVEVASDSKYAQIHNEGGYYNVRISRKMRKFFWAMYYKTKDNKWKLMALTKRSYFSLKFPKRQFMGDSITFNKYIESLFFKTIITRFKAASNTI